MATCENPQVENNEILRQHLSNIVIEAQQQSKLKGTLYYLLFASPLGKYLFPKQHALTWALTKAYFNN